MHLRYCRNSATTAVDLLPQLRTTAYDRIIAACLVAAITSSLLLATAVAIWLGNTIAGIVDPDPPVPPELSNAESPVSELVLAEVEVASPEAADADHSVKNEETSVTQLEQIEAFEAAGVAASEVVIPIESAAENSQLPNAATGDGTKQLGIGLSRGMKTLNNRQRGREHVFLIEFPEARSLDEHARRLESLGIQPGALLKSPDRLVYLSELSDVKPSVTESQEGDSEKRMFLSWAEGSESLVQADRDLFARAGVEAADVPIFHFISQQTEELLEKLAMKHAGQEDLSRIRRTTFGIQSEGDGFKFFVMRQSFR